MGNYIFGAIGVLGGIFTNHYIILVWCYYMFAEQWKYPCFLLFQVTTPLLFISFGIFMWRAIRLESVSFPAMAMFSHFYFGMGALYATGIVF